MQKRIVVVGSVNLDLVAGTQRIPVAGETVAGSSFQTFPGGKGANQAVAAARLGSPVSFVGRVGTDSFGTLLRTALNEAGVETSSVSSAEGPSGVAVIATGAGGENSIIVVAGANGQVSPGYLDSQLDVIRSAGILLAQLEIPLESVEHLARIARRESIPLMLDPAPARTLPGSLLKSVDWLTPNETETCTLLGMAREDFKADSLDKAASAFLALGARNVILKLGERGCYLALADGSRKQVPACRVDAVDTTAAGDAFNGAFAAALLQGKDPVECAVWASAVAAISVTRHGAQTSMPSRAEVESFLRQR